MIPGYYLYAEWPAVTCLLTGLMLPSTANLAQQLSSASLVIEPFTVDSVVAAINQRILASPTNN